MLQSLGRIRLALPLREWLDKAVAKLQASKRDVDRQQGK